MAETNGGGKPQPSVGQAIWLGACLFFFGGVIGVMAALNEQVGSTAALIAALLTFVGGSLAALYRPANLPEEARPWIVQAAGLISLGLFAGLCGGFWLRYYDQAHLMTGIVRERATLDRELRKEGQRLADYWGDLKDKGETKAKADGTGNEPPKPVAVPRPSVSMPAPVPRPSVSLRAEFEKQSVPALQELHAVIARLQEPKGNPEEQGRAKQLIADLKTHRKVIEQPKGHSPGYLLAHVEMAENELAELKEESARKRLQELREKGFEKREDRGPGTPPSGHGPKNQPSPGDRARCYIGGDSPDLTDST